MNWIWKGLWYFLRRYLEGQAVLRAKRQGVIAYIRALQGTRQVLLALIIAFFAFHLVVFAGVGTLVTGMFLLDLETKTILAVLFGVFAFCFFVPVTILCIAFSERTWYRYSGAEKMVEDLKREAA